MTEIHKKLSLNYYSYGMYFNDYHRIKLLGGREQILEEYSTERPSHNPVGHALVLR